MRRVSHKRSSEVVHSARRTKRARQAKEHVQPKKEEEDQKLSMKRVSWDSRNGVMILYRAPIERSPFIRAWEPMKDVKVELKTMSSLYTERHDVTTADRHENRWTMVLSNTIPDGPITHVRLSIADETSDWTHVVPMMKTRKCYDCGDPTVWAVFNCHQKYFHLWNTRPTCAKCQDYADTRQFNQTFVLGDHYTPQIWDSSIEDYRSMTEAEARQAAEESTRARATA